MRIAEHQIAGYRSIRRNVVFWYSGVLVLSLFLSGTSYASASRKPPRVYVKTLRNGHIKPKIAI